MKKLFLIGSVTCLLGPLSYAQSLEHTLTNALKRSPEITKAIEQSRIAASEIGLAKSGKRPQVSIQADSGPAYRDRSIDGIATGTGESLLSRKASATVQQLLLDWGQSGRLVRSAELRHEFENYLVEEEMEQQALFITETYLDLIKFRLQAQVMGQRLAFLEKQQKRAKGAEGVEGTTDTIILASRIATARANRIEYSQLAESLEVRLEQLSMLDIGDIDFPPMPKQPDLESTPKNNPQYQAAIAALESSKENTSAVAKERMPKVFFEARGGVGEDYLGIDGPDNDASALLVFRWNPYEGGRKKAALEKARAQEGLDSAAIKTVMDSINDQVNLATKEMTSANLRYDELHNAVVDLRKAIADYESNLDNGVEGTQLLSLVSMYTEQSKAQSSIVDAHVQRHKAAYALLAASGRMLDYFGIPASINETGK